MSEQIDSAIRWGTEKIESCSECARLDAELLMAHCLNKPRSFLYSWPEHSLSDSCWQHFQVLVHKRIEPTPVAYLLGTREFYALEYTASPAALIPRPETELLIELALQHIPTNKAIRVLDLGTGTGNIAITLKKHRPRANLYATDIDSACLALARENATRHQIEIEFTESNWYQNLEAVGVFDLIVSNPPYIAAGHPFLSRGDLPAEPILALSPGASGLEALQQIIGQAQAHLVEGGYLVVEHGYDQQAEVANLFASHGFDSIYCALDFNELPRVSMAKLIENQGSRG